MNLFFGIFLPILALVDAFLAGAAFAEGRKWTALWVSIVALFVVFVGVMNFGSFLLEDAGVLQ